MTKKSIPDVKDFSISFLLKFKKDSKTYFSQLQKEYGDVYKKNFLGLKNYFFCHPDHAEYILSTNQNNFYKHPIVMAIFKDFIGEESLFTTKNNIQWQRDRSIAEMSFDAMIFFEQYAKTIVKQCKELTEYWQQQLYAGSNNIPISHNLDVLVLKIIRETLFHHIDIDVENLANHLPDMFNAMRDKGTSITKLPYIFPTKKKRIFTTEVNRFQKIADKILNTRLQSKLDYDDILGNFLHAYPIDLNNSDNYTIVSHEIMTFNMIGFSTTTSALSSILLTLAKNPECEQALVDEISSICNDRLPTYADYIKLKYTKAFVNEVLRLFPPIVLLLRQAMEPDSICGYDIPRNASIFLNIAQIHHHPDFWEKPDEFNPMRFIDREINHPFAFIPYGAGKRICIGKQFSFMALCLILIMVVQRFKVKLPGDFRLKWYYVASVFYRPEIANMYLQLKKT